jgi:hypothetical protein
MRRNNGIRKGIILLAAITAVVLWPDWAVAQRRIGAPGGATREYRGRDRRGEREETDTAVTASEDINSKLQIILNVVNEGGSLEPKEIEIAKRSLLENRKFLKDFTETEQSEYYLLSAWMNYFAGYYRRALGEANKACKANPDDGDAMATQIALSMLNNEFHTVAEQTKGREEITIFGAEIGARGAGQESRTGRTLDFNLDFIKGGVLGNKVSNLKLTCLNGSSLSYIPDKEVICLVIWKTELDKSTEAPIRVEPGNLDMTFGAGPRGGPRRARTSRRSVEDASEQMLAFSELFLEYYENPQLRFVGLNTDSLENKTKVMETLLENSWPWAQAMVTEPANKAVLQFADMKIRQPTLVIAQVGGTIFYAGPPAGFLPKMLLNYVTGVTGQQAEEQETEIQAKQTGSKTMAAESFEGPAKNRQDKLSAWPEAEEEQINPHADNLYQMALVHKKSARVLGYGRMVEYCRQIQELYPDSPQAKQAKELLRQLPEQERKKYKITDQEMGL